MSAPSGNLNKGSRWGSLLSGAVAGLESRLDSILAEDDQASARQRAEESAARQDKLKQKQNALRAEQPTSRASSRGRPSDRLQERLAKAAVKGIDTPRSSSRAASEKQSVPASPLIAAPAHARSSTDSAELGAQQDLSSDPLVASSPLKGLPQDANDVEQSSVSVLLSLPAPELAPSPAVSTPNVPSLRPSQDSGRSSIDSIPLPSTPPTTVRRASFLEAELSRVTKQHEEQVLNYQEELLGYLERIDALQSKLQYLASTAAKDAHSAAEEADKGSFRQRLAEKDEKIAQLLEEGQKLSANETKAMGNVRTLRNRLQEEEKNKVELKRKLEVTEQEVVDAKDRARRAEERDRTATEKLRAVPRLEREIQELKAELVAANAQIAELKKMLLEAEAQADEAEERAQTDKVEEQIKVIAELNDELSNARIEKRLVEGRMKKEINEVKEEAKRQHEKAKLAELELKAEIQVRSDLRYEDDRLTNLAQTMEAKLEALRSRTEEASSSAPSSAQTALLRQIETLQTQYALATENWQGIESSLNARITTLEKDRDEVARREADMRKKVREANSKARRLEEELDSTKEKTSTLEAENSELQAAMAKMQSSLSAAEKTISDARAELERDRKAFEETLQSRIEEEKTKWQLEANPTSATVSVTESHFLGVGSPPASHSQLRKPLTPDLLGLHARRMGSANNTGSRTFSSDLPPISTDGYARPHSRRTSTNPQGLFHPHLPVRTPTESFTGPTRQDSTITVPYLNGGNNSSGSIPPSTSVSVAPSINEIGVGEEPLDRAPTESSSPHRTINDLVSHSTVGAGPSVQLVERMSAAVRRLESEKAANKEEMARLISQRDEAREEVVSLMREVEEVRKEKEKMVATEKELAEVRQRYEASLEMLGEKQEQCEELKNDVLDLKKIYRELVESTVK